MKRLTQTLAFCLLTVFTAVAQKNYVSEVWVSDLGNGKYKIRCFMPTTPIRTLVA